MSGRWHHPPHLPPQIETSTSLRSNSVTPLSTVWILQRCRIIMIFYLAMPTTPIATTQPSSRMEARYRNIRSLRGIFRLVCMRCCRMNNIRTSFHGWWVSVLISLHIMNWTELCTQYYLLFLLISQPPPSFLYHSKPHGRAWKVLNKKLLVEEAIPKFFGQSKYASFTRQLSGWGFKRLHQTGPGKFNGGVGVHVV